MLFLGCFKLVNFILVWLLLHMWDRGFHFFYHILTSSVIYYWTDARQLGIYLLNIYIYIYWFFITRSEGRDYTLWINEEKISCHQCNKITGTNFEVPSKTNGNRSALWDHSGQIFSGKTQEKASVSKAVIFHLFYFTIDSIIVTHSFLWFNIQLLFHFLVF